jgi:hypothetical protein
LLFERFQKDKNSHTELQHKLFIEKMKVLPKMEINEGIGQSWKPTKALAKAGG